MWVVQNGASASNFSYRDASIADIFVGLFAIAGQSRHAGPQLSIPPILFVIGGTVSRLDSGFPKWLPILNWFFFFILPPLLFPAALFTRGEISARTFGPISLLAIGLVLFTTVAVAYLAHYFMNLPLAAGFVLGAIISPPDAIAATAIAERLNLPRRIVTILKAKARQRRNRAGRLPLSRCGRSAVHFHWRTRGYFIVGGGGILAGGLAGATLGHG